MWRTAWCGSRDRARSRSTSSSGGSPPRAVRAVSTPTRRTRGSSCASTSSARRRSGPRQRARLLEKLGPGRAGRRVGTALAAPEPRARARAAAANGSRPRCTSSRRGSRREPSRVGRSAARVEQKRRVGERKRDRRRPSRRTMSEHAMTVVGDVLLLLVGRRDRGRSCSTPRSARSCCRAARRSSSRASCSAAVRSVLELFSRAGAHATKQRDRVMALYAPVALLALPDGLADR